MKLALHHFRKEVSHVRLRWLLWLALLALQMAVNLEWVAPMPPDFNWDYSLLNPSWLMMVKPVIWGVAFWLVASSVPEDRPGTPDRFLATRPLPLHSYLLGRVLAFLVLVAAPFAVQEALYLWFCDRPWPDILLGAGEAAFWACAVLGWWLPFSLLWRRTREMWLGEGVVVVSVVLAFLALSVVIDRSSEKLVYKPDLLPSEGLRLQHVLQWPGWLLVGAFILAIAAWAHLRQGWKLWQRLAAVSATTVVVLLGGFTVQLPNPSMRPVAQAEVERLAAGIRPAFTGYEFSVMTRREYGDYEIWMQGPVEGVPAGYLPHWRRQKVTLQHAEGSTLTARSMAPAYHTAFHAWLGVPVQRAFADLFPPDSVWRVNHRGLFERGVDVGRLAVPESGVLNRGPLQVEGKYALDWIKWDREAELPLTVGSTASSAVSRWTVIAVDPDRSQWGSPLQGALCVTLRLEHRVQSFGRQPWDFTQEFAPVLHAPELGLVFGSPWIGADSTLQQPHAQVAARAESTTWQRHIFRLAWKEVTLVPGGEKGPVGRGLRMAVLRRSYAGTTLWGIALQGDSVQEEEAFLKRLRALPVLGEKATVEEAQRYFADVLDILQPIANRPWKTWLTPMVERLEPVARMHPALLLKVKSDYPWPEILGRLAVVPAMRDAILTEMPAKPWLGKVVNDASDWQPLARERAPMIMSTVKPQDGAYFSKLFMSWRDPAHVPWLIRVMEAGLDTELYLYCRSFPEHRDAADATARRAALAEMRRVGPVLNERDPEPPPGIALGLRAGLPEALERVLHLLRVANPTERDLLYRGARLPEAFRFRAMSTDASVQRTELKGWLSALTEQRPADFRFDEEERVWLRKDRQADAGPQNPAPSPSPSPPPQPSR